MTLPPRDANAVEALIERHTDRAYAAACRLTGNPSEAWDLVQESFLRALDKADLYDPRQDFGGWLYRILFRVFLNRRRGDPRRREIPIEPAAGEEASAGGFRISDPAEMPDAVLERGERQRRISDALDKLPEDFRACLVLVDMEGRGYQEAAEVLGWPVGSVAGRLFRARRLLRELLKEGEI